MKKKKIESKKNPLTGFRKISREYREIHFPAREKVQEEALVIIVASVVLSAVVFAIDTVSWQIFHTFL